MQEASTPTPSAATKKPATARRAAAAKPTALAAGRKSKTTKPAGTATPAPTAQKGQKGEKGEKGEKVAKAKKPKLVRDSFTIPKDEYAALAALKQRCEKLGHPSKKSELLRAAIAALNAMGDKALLAAVRAVPSLKTGRPKKA